MYAPGGQNSVLLDITKSPRESKSRQSDLSSAASVAP